MAKRFEIFLTNLKYITESNAERRSPSSYLLGLNKFADWSPKEFQEVYLHNFDVATATEHRGMKLKNVSYAPSSLDWRQKGAVAEVKDEGRCGKISDRAILMLLWK